MRPLEQLKKKVRYIGLYLFDYLIASSVIIIAFGFIYKLNKVYYPWQMSLEIFWGFGERIPLIVYNWVFLERVVNELFVLIFVGKILEKFLKPINPIITCKYAIYDTVNEKFSFRYWIMFPQNIYLYDVKIRVLLTEYETHQRGINQLKTIWELDSEIQNLDQIRGIRFIELSEADSQNLLKAIEKLLQADNGSGKRGKWSIDLAIRGNDENGNTYYKWSRYYYNRVLLGYRYVPLQRHEYDSDSFYSLKKNLVNVMDFEYQDFYKTNKKEFFRYQHFDKVYKLPSSASISDKRIYNDILSEKQIRVKPFKGIQQSVLDLCSLVTWFILDSDRKIEKMLMRRLKRIVKIK